MPARSRLRIDQVGGSKVHAARYGTVPIPIPIPIPMSQLHFGWARLPCLGLGALLVGY